MPAPEPALVTRAYTRDVILQDEQALPLRHNDGSVQLLRTGVVTPPWVLAAAASDQTFIHREQSQRRMGSPPFMAQQRLTQPQASSRSVRFQPPSATASSYSQRYYTAGPQPQMRYFDGSSGTQTPYSTRYQSQEQLYGAVAGNAAY